MERILVLNGSPRMEKSNTQKILNPFLQGAKEAGANIEEIYLRKLNINHCTKCNECKRNIGKCCIKDDAAMLIEKFLNSDTLVIATPIYDFSCTSYISKAIIRLVYPFIGNTVRLDNGQIHNISNFNDKKYKIITILNGSFDGEYTFGPLVNIFSNIVESVVDNNNNRIFNLIANIQVGFGALLMDNKISLDCASRLANNFHVAGLEFINNGHISKETLKLVNKPIYDYLGISRQQALKKHCEIIKYGMQKYKQG